MPDSDITSRYAFARAVAAEAGALTLRYFGSDIVVDRKADDSPVTAADREAERLLRQRIAAEFPHDAIFGEEFGQQDGTSPFRWVLDPIDGTKSFIAGVPLYGTLVGVVREDRCVIGVVGLPALGASVDAAVGHGAWHDSGSGRVPARVSTVGRLADGLVITTEFEGYVRRDAVSAFADLSAASSYLRTWGDCYGYYLVATGRAVAMVDPLMSLWDAAAVQPIMEEAGGTFTDWRGESTISAGEGLGTNGLVLHEVLAVTGQFAL